MQGPIAKACQFGSPSQSGEAHDNRLATRLLSRLESGAMLLADRRYDAAWIRALVGQYDAWTNFHRD